MNIIFASLIAIIIILLLIIFATWLDKFGRKQKVELIEKVIDRVSSLVSSKIALVTDLQKAGPCYLVVYTKDSNYPIWVSHNNIRSVHPDRDNCKIIIKQFNGEDMVIENVENYELCLVSDLCDYDM